MRVWEILLLLADLSAYLALSIRQLRGKHGMRYAPIMIVLAPAMAAIQCLAEGPRWQMLPAYALTMLFLLAWLAQNAAPMGGLNGWKRPHPAAVAVVITLGALGLAIAAALPMVVPVFRFSEPSGPYAIGSLTYHWVDASRAEPFAADHNERRQLMVQVWYPAQAHTSGQRAAYMADADTVTAAFARLHGKPAFLFGHLKYVTTNARSSVAAAADQRRYPVLLFLEGATGFRQMNTFQVEHLASHGYIVVAIDQPGAAAAVVFPDGHRAIGLTVPQFHSLRACLMMDAPMSTDVVKAGLQQPGMWITRDAGSMRLERERAGGWPDTEIEAHQRSMRATYEGLSGAGYFVRVPGMFHSNFTDVARWTPLSRVLGLSGPIDERRAHGIVNAYSLAFFDRHLLGRPALLLDGAVGNYPEVLFESRRP